MSTITAAQTSAIQSAATPEEAYKVFAGAATEFIGKAVADALAKALGTASTATAQNASIAGWEAYVKGANMHMEWGTPGVRTPPSTLNTFATAPITEPTAVKAMGVGVSISIGISGSF